MSWIENIGQQQEYRHPFLGQTESSSSSGWGHILASAGLAFLSSWGIARLVGVESGKSAKIGVLSAILQLAVERVLPSKQAQAQAQIPAQTQPPEEELSYGEKSITELLETGW